jgi:hypothetical protein
MRRHREERSDDAISTRISDLDCFACGSQCWVDGPLTASDVPSWRC